MEDQQRNKKAIRLSTQAGYFVQNHSTQEFSRGMRLQNAWETIATPQVLLHTDSTVFSKRKHDPGVIIYVDTSHWAATLGAQRELYRILLEKETGWEIPSLKFYVTRDVSFKKFFKKKERHDKKNKEKIAIPLIEKEDRYARELVSIVQNKELQERLYRAVKADFQWKKGRNTLKLP
jgi:hypothetical protein